MIIEKKKKFGFKTLLIGIAVFLIAVGVSSIVLVKNANRIIKNELERRLGKAFSIENIDLKWGSVEVTGVTLKSNTGKEVIKVDNLSLRADFIGLLRKQYIISSLTIRNPYLFVELNQKGEIVNPVLPAELKPKKEGKGDALSVKHPGQKSGMRLPRSEKQTQSTASDKVVQPLIIKDMKVINGAVDYLDRKTPVTPVLTKIRSINIDLSDLSVPFSDSFSQYTLRAAIPGSNGTGNLASNGRIKFKTKDMICKTILRDLDITGFKPYYAKESPVNVTRGFLDITIDVNITSQRIHAPGTAVLKNLDFAGGSGVGNKFMGVPLSIVVSFLKESDGRIPIQFVLEGNLNNPKFNLKEHFIQKFSIAVAEKLGFSLKGIAESILGIGSTGAGQTGTSLKDIGEGLKGLFDRK